MKNLNINTLLNNVKNTPKFNHLYAVRLPSLISMNEHRKDLIDSSHLLTQVFIYKRKMSLGITILNT